MISWLGSSRMDSGNYQTRYAVMEALGQMGPLLSDDRIYKNTTQVSIFYYEKYSKRISIVFSQYHRLSSINANNLSFDLGSAFINNPVQKEWN